MSLQIRINISLESEKFNGPKRKNKKKFRFRGRKFYLIEKIYFNKNRKFVLVFHRVLSGFVKFFISSARWRRLTEPKEKRENVVQTISFSFFLLRKFTFSCWFVFFKKFISSMCFRSSADCCSLSFFSVASAFCRTSRICRSSSLLSSSSWTSWKFSIKQ